MATLYKYVPPPPPGSLAIPIVAVEESKDRSVGEVSRLEVSDPDGVQGQHVLLILLLSQVCQPSRGEIIMEDILNTLV